MQVWINNLQIKSNKDTCFVTFKTGSTYKKLYEQYCIFLNEKLKTHIYIYIKGYEIIPLEKYKTLNKYRTIKKGCQSVPKIKK